MNDRIGLDELRAMRDGTKLDLVALGCCYFCFASKDEAELKIIEGVPGYSPFLGCADHAACLERIG